MAQPPPLSLSSAVQLLLGDYADYAEEMADNMQLSGFMEFDIEIALTIFHYRTSRSRQRYLQKLRSVARLLTLGFFGLCLDLDTFVRFTVLAASVHQRGH